MSEKLENAKGTRDFLPEEKILRDKITNKLVQVFELYGYSPIETPILMRYEVLSAKFAAGEESDAMKETFKLKDQGDRDLGLRFDLTVPFSKFVGINPNLKMPFKRYEIGKVYRDGPIKLGRYREFWQCDVDIVGCSKMTADAEIILLSLDAFKRMGLDAYMEVNNRKLLQGLLLDCGVRESLLISAMISLDKLDKYGKESVLKEMDENGIMPESGEMILELFGKIKATKNNSERINLLRTVVKSDLAKQGLLEIESLMTFLDNCEANQVVLNAALARGLGYYTGTVFEGHLKNSKITSSVCGGGRYDEMIGQYLDAKVKNQFPAVGISFGLDVICEAIKIEGITVPKTVTQVFIIPIQTQKQCFELAKVLRENDIRVDIDLIGRGISKNMDYANKQEIPFVLFVGPDELAQGKVKLKDMKSGNEELIGVEEVMEKVK